MNSTQKRTRDEVYDERDPMGAKRKIQKRKKTIEENELNFNDLKNKVEKVLIKKRKYHELYINSEKIYRKLQDKLEEICNHNWEIDRSVFSYDGTQYTCKNCNSQNR